MSKVTLPEHSLTGADIRESRLGRVPSATRAVTAGTATSATSATTATSATSANSAPVSRLDYRSSAAAAIPGGAGHVRASVTCDGTLAATGGGAKVSNPDVAFINDSNPV